MNSTPWRNEQWYTSHWNFNPELTKSYKFADKVQFRDVSLRDGEQQPGLLFNKDQKVEIAEKLAAVGIHSIEAGMPLVSRQDEEAIREIVKRKFGPSIYSFARCLAQDAELAQDMGCDGVIMEIAGNKELLQYGYQWDRQRAVDAAVTATSAAHERDLDVVLFLIDTARADFDFLIGFIDEVNRDGHFDALTCVDTYGVLNPFAAYHIIGVLKEKYPDKRIEIHCHNDFGMGAAATVMGLAAGADVAHTTISGIGERAGNVAYEDVAFTLLALFGVDTGLKWDLLYPTSRFIHELAGIECRANEGIIGPSINKMAAGLPIGWYEKVKSVDPLILLPYRWTFTGHPDVEYCIGKHSGGPVIKHYLKKLGLPDDDEDKNTEILNNVKDAAYNKGTTLTVEEFQKIAEAIITKA